MTTVRELIEILQKYDQDLPVIIEPLLDYKDCETSWDQAYFLIQDQKNISPLILRVGEAQSSRDPGDSSDSDYIEYGFNQWIDPIDKKLTLIISSPAFKYCPNKINDK